MNFKQYLAEASGSFRIPGLYGMENVEDGPILDLEKEKADFDKQFGDDSERAFSDYLIDLEDESGLPPWIHVAGKLLGAKRIHNLSDMSQSSFMRSTFHLYEKLLEGGVQKDAFGYPLTIGKLFGTPVIHMDAGNSWKFFVTLSKNRITQAQVDTVVAKNKKLVLDYLEELELSPDLFKKNKDTYIKTFLQLYRAGHKEDLDSNGVFMSASAAALIFSRALGVSGPEIDAIAKSVLNK